jgi:hypothetical protein
MLHGIHNVRLLSQERISQIGSPSNVGIQPIENIRKNYQSLNARIPILLTRGVHQLRALEIPILPQPLCRFHHFERIGARHQHLAE